MTFRVLALINGHLCQYTRGEKHLMETGNWKFTMMGDIWVRLLYLFYSYSSYKNVFTNVILLTFSCCLIH